MPYGMIKSTVDFVKCADCPREFDDGINVHTEMNKRLSDGGKTCYYRQQLYKDEENDKYVIGCTNPDRPIDATFIIN